MRVRVDQAGCHEQIACVYDLINIRRRDAARGAHLDDLAIDDLDVAALGAMAGRRRQQAETTGDPDRGHAPGVPLAASRLHLVNQIGRAPWKPPLSATPQLQLRSTGICATAWVIACSTRS